MKEKNKEYNPERLYSALVNHWKKKEHPTYDRNLHIYTGLGFDDDFVGMFVDYLGSDEIIERLDKIINKNSTWTPIHDCGSYHFDFVLRTFELEYEDYIVEIYANVKMDGTVVIDGELKTIEDALLDDNFGWEVEGEIKDCIGTQIYDEVERETGFRVHIQFT